MGEIGVLGEEAVAGVDGVGAGGFCCGKQLFDVEIGFGAGGAVQGDGFVGEANERGVGIRVGVDGHAGDACVAGTTDDADGDLAAVRN